MNSLKILPFVYPNTKHAPLQSCLEGTEGPVAMNVELSHSPGTTRPAGRDGGHPSVGARAPGVVASSVAPSPRRPLSILGHAKPNIRNLSEFRKLSSSRVTNHLWFCCLHDLFSEHISLFESQCPPSPLFTSNLPSFGITVPHCVPPAAPALLFCMWFEFFPGIPLPGTALTLLFHLLIH